MKYDGNGYLRIKATAGGGAIPIEGAVVRVFGIDEENYGIEYTLLTDMDGLTGVFTLPAPSASYSLVPEPAEVPYGSYRAEIRRVGYEDVDIQPLQIFDGIAGVLPVNMLSAAATPTPNQRTTNTTTGEDYANTNNT